jgi:magnesium transporter
LANMEISFIVAIIRHSESGFKPQLMKLLPEKTRIACRLLLNYAEDAVGAWMVTNTTTLPDTCTVEEALVRLIDDKETTVLNTIYVVDRARLIKGSVTNINLLRALPNSPISLVMDKTVEAISARTSLISASSYSVWNHLDTVPLINRNKQLVGVLRHSDLRKGLNQISTTITPTDNTNPVNAIFEIYSQSLVALLNTVTEVTHQGHQQGKPS